MISAKLWLKGGRTEGVRLALEWCFTCAWAILSCLYIGFGKVLPPKEHFFSCVTDFVTYSPMQNTEVRGSEKHRNMSVHSGVPGAVLPRYSPGKWEIKPACHEQLLGEQTQNCAQHLQNVLCSYKWVEQPELTVLRESQTQLIQKGVKAHTSQVS